MNENAETVKGLLTVRETAAELRISRPTAYRLCATGELPSVRVGGQIRIPANLLVDRLARSRVARTERTTE